MYYFYFELEGVDDDDCLDFDFPKDDEHVLALSSFSLLSIILKFGLAYSSIISIPHKNHQQLSSKSIKLYQFLANYFLYVTFQPIFETICFIFSIRRSI